ncbi:MAG: alpha-2-macroglobulin, partial [Deltaproteobacteria bacterium]
MKLLKSVIFILLLIMISTAVYGVHTDHAQLRKEAQKAYADGNWKVAYELYSKLCLELTNDPKRVGGDLAQAYHSLQRLNRMNELDDFREKVISRHSQNWRLLLEAARIYSDNPHWGYMVAGKFERGYHRGSGKYMNAIQRDRVRALQLMAQAMPLAANDPARSEVANFYLEFAGMLLQYGGYNQSWRLQYLTDLTRLPDYEPGYGHYDHSGIQGAPVDDRGNPVFHHVPESFQSAASDGERWRWLLIQAGAGGKRIEDNAKSILAAFLHQQFGVQTMAAYGRYFPWGRPVQ